MTGPASYDGRLRRGVVTTWVVVGAFAAVTVVRSVQVGVPLRDPGGSILVGRVAVSLGLFVVLTAVDAVRRTPRGRRTAAGVRRTWSTRWTGPRTALALGALLAYHLVYFCYHNLKSWDAFDHPRDAMLGSWDRRLFLGHTPAVVLHDLLGQHLAAYVLTGVYESFSTLLALAVGAAVALPRRMRDTYAFVASGIWVWILGVGSYYLIPSLGPFHSSPQDFAGLSHTLVQSTQAAYLSQRADFLADPLAPGAFAQVSAFASLHVAVTTYLLLMARHFGLRRLTAVMWVFVPATMVATVYLGWHFAVDDLAGVAIAVVAVRAGTATVGSPRSVRRSAPAGAPPAERAVGRRG